jgi:hypothetical protein
MGPVRKETKYVVTEIAILSAIALFTMHSSAEKNFRTYPATIVFMKMGKIAAEQHKAISCSLTSK